MEKTEEKENFWSEYGFTVLRIAVSVVLTVLSVVLPVGETVKIIICISAAIISGFELIAELPESLKEKRFFDENTLMIIASTVAFILGERIEGALIIILFSLGEFLEDIATESSHKKIAGLAEIKSDVARLVVGNSVSEVNPESVMIGSIIEVRKGDRVPIDGVLLGEAGEFDLKAITGESKFYSIGRGEKVYGGAINEGNVVRIKTTEKYNDSTAERIIALVESSGAKKAKAQKFITEFAKIYTPCIIALAVLISVVPPLFDGYDFSKWILKALNFMVISCPCALVISVPLGYFVGIGSLARRGILVKGGNYVETLSKVRSFAFDKTGTITEGNLSVNSIVAKNGVSEKEVITAAYVLEKYSSHPIAKAVISYCENKADKNAVAINVKEIAGKGIAGEINGEKYAVGNEKLLDNVPSETENFGAGLVVIKNGIIIGYVSLSDTVKSSARTAVKKLKKGGIKNFYILSGDGKEQVKAAAEEVGIDNCYSSLLPENKLEIAEKLIKDKGVLAFVGDGINDAPVLRRADVGIAMGGLGSEAAIESADIVIMDDDLSKISTAYSHSKKIRKIVLENIICSIGVKIAIMSLSVIFTLPAFAAMLGDVGVMLMAVVNSLRNYRIKENR